MGNNMKSVLFLAFVLMVNTSYLSGQVYSENQDSLTFARSFTLNEDSLIVENINNISYSQNNEFYLVSSMQTDELPIYYNKNNSVFKIIRLDMDLSDSVVQHYTKFGKQFNGWSLYSKREVKETVGSSPLLNMMRETFEYAEFIDDSTIVILCNVDFARTIDTEDLLSARIRRNSHGVGVLFYNIMNDSFRFVVLEDEFLEFQNKILTFIQPVKFSLDLHNRCFYIPSRSSRYLTDTINQKIYSTASKLDFSGKFVKNISLLPDEYLNSGLNYLYDYKPNISNDGRNLVLQFPILPYFTLNGNKIVMSGFYSDNTQLFDSIKGITVDSKDIMKIGNIIREAQPFHNTSIQILKNQMIMTSTYIRKEKNELREYFPIIQFYNFEGRLLGTTHPKMYNRNGKFKFLGYNKYSNEIMIIRKNNLNWEVEVYEINY
jgi:hypothetical protein